MNIFLSDRQKAFRKRHSRETQLIIVLNDWVKMLDKDPTIFADLQNSLVCGVPFLSNIYTGNSLQDTDLVGGTNTDFHIEDNESHEQLLWKTDVVEMTL